MICKSKMVALLTVAVMLIGAINTIALAGDGDVYLCAMAKTYSGENHNDGRCDICDKLSWISDPVRGRHCGQAYEWCYDCASKLLKKTRIMNNR
jgi:hypothetical protein